MTREHPPGEDDPAEFVGQSLDADGHFVRWLAAQHGRIAAEFPTNILDELETVVRGVLHNRTQVVPPLQRGQWCFRFDAGSGAWLQSTWSGKHGLGPWSTLKLGAANNPIDPTHASNFVVCPYSPSRSSSSTMASRAMIRLSSGGTDSAESREFDLATGEPVPDGFHVPHGVHHLCWDGPNALLVSRLLITEAGERRWIVDRFERGQMPLRLQEFATDRVTAAISRDSTATSPRYLMTEWLDHRRRIYHLCTHAGATGPWCTVPVPMNVRIQLMGEIALLVPMSTWTTPEGTWDAGDLLATPVSGVLRGELNVRPVHRAPQQGRVAQIAFTRNRALISETGPHRTRLLTLDPVSGVEAEIADHDSAVTIRTTPVDVANSSCADEAWIETAGPLTPPTIARIDTLHPNRRWIIEEGRSTFDDAGFALTTHSTVFGTATPVRYVVVAPVGMPRDGENPTIISVYGGFGAHERIHYLDLTGPTWLDLRAGNGRRCVFVHAYVGHSTTSDSAPWVRLDRSINQLLAVASALEAAGIARPGRLGANGASHGGLVVLNAMLRRPAAFGAVVCQSAVLDLIDYPDLDGTAWIGEYGDPRDPASRRAMLPLSPYHQIVGGQRYPPVLLWASSHDDRVSPVHSRRAAARLESVGSDVLYLENTNGGHDALGSTPAGIKGLALITAFFRRHLAGT